jgi:hypothetical protein
MRQLLSQLRGMNEVLYVNCSQSDHASYAYSPQHTAAAIGATVLVLMMERLKVVGNVVVIKMYGAAGKRLQVDY